MQHALHRRIAGGNLFRQLDAMRAHAADQGVRLMGDVPIGTMCSGGVDSSLIAKFAVEEQPGIRAYLLL